MNQHAVPSWTPECAERRNCCANRREEKTNFQFCCGIIKGKENANLEKEEEREINDASTTTPVINNPSHTAA